MVLNRLLTLFLVATLVACAGSPERRVRPCTPVILSLPEAITLETGGWVVSFEVLAAGCKEELARSWPPDNRRLQAELEEMVDPVHPVAIMMQIRDKSPELAHSLVGALNRALGESLVKDAFLYDGEAIENAL